MGAPLGPAYPYMRVSQIVGDVGQVHKRLLCLGKHLPSHSETKATASVGVILPILFCEQEKRSCHPVIPHRRSPCSLPIMLRTIIMLLSKLIPSTREYTNSVLMCPRPGTRLLRRTVIMFHQYYRWETRRKGIIPL